MADMIKHEILSDKEARQPAAGVGGDAKKLDKVLSGGGITITD